MKSPHKTTTLNGAGHTVHMYRVKFKAPDGSTHYWERYGETMEGALKSAKRAIVKEYGELGSVEICGDQGDGVYNF